MLATLIVWGHPSGTPAPQNSPYTPEPGTPPRRLSEAQAYEAILRYAVIPARLFGEVLPAVKKNREQVRIR